MRWRRRIEEQVAEMLQMAERNVERRSTLTDEERQELASRWAQMACSFCGGWHGGLCNRVRRVELDERGLPKVTVFWETWEPDPRTIWPEDVWTSPAQRAKEMEAQERDRAAQLEMNRVAAREAERVRREQTRTESPREALSRVTQGRQ